MLIKIAVTVFLILTIAASIRVILGPTIWDRMLGLNLISSKLVMIIILYAMLQERSYLLDIAIAFALLGGLGIMFIAIFVQKRGKI